MSNKAEEIKALAEEWERRERALTEEWYRTHKRAGRDGGPTEQRKKLQKEIMRRHAEIIEKYL